MWLMEERVNLETLRQAITAKIGFVSTGRVMEISKLDSRSFLALERRCAYDNITNRIKRTINRF